MLQWLRFNFFCLLLSFRYLYSLSATWNVDGNGNWNENFNWIPITFPNAASDVAAFSTTISQDVTVTLGIPITVGNITFLETSHAYTIASNTLTLDTLAGDALISLLPGNTSNHTLSSSLALDTNLAISNDTTGSLLLSGPISGTGTLTTSGSGTLILTGSLANTFTGLTTIPSGRVELSKPSGTHAISGDVTLSGGTLVLTNTNQVNDSSNMTLSSGTFDMNSFSEKVQSLTFEGGTITNNGGLTLTTLSMGNTTMPGTLTLLGNATFTADGATLTNLSLDSGSHSFTIDTGSASIVGEISGQGGFSKAGNGTIEFSGTSSNTYSGLTTISAGTLQISKTGGATGFSGDVLVAGGTLLLNSANQLHSTSDLTLSSGTFDMNSTSQTLKTFTFTGGTLSNNGGLFLTTLSIGTVTVPDTVTLDGNATFTADGATLTNLSLPSGTHSLSAETGTASISGVISGAGALTKTGTGILEFSGSAPNTYSGITTLLAGTLRLSKSTSIDAIAGNIDIEGGTLFLTNAHQISSTSAMTLSSGTFDMNSKSQLLQSLTYTGGTISNNGGLTLTTLALGNATIPGSVTLSGDATFTADGATLTNLSLSSGTHICTSNSGTASITGVISGTGALTKRGNGALEFSGSSPNTYTALTTLSEGTLRLNKTAGTNALAGDLDINGGTLFFAQANQLSSASSVTLSSGTFDMNGMSETFGSFTFTDGTVKNNGGLTLTSLTMRNTTMPGTVTLVDSFTFDPNNNGFAILTNVDFGTTNTTFTVGNGTATFDVIINESSSSGGSFVKEGTGVLLLNGSHTHVNGEPKVNSGMLHITGTLSAQSFEVGQSATLKGTGTINAPTLLKGTIQQGASIGTMSFTGDQTFDATSVTEVELNPTVSDLIDIDGALTISPGATLKLLPEGGFFPNTFSYTIIQTTGGVTGTYTTIISPSLFQGEVQYTGNNVLLEVTKLPLLTFPLKGNARAVAECLDTLDLDPNSDLAIIRGKLCSAFTTRQLKECLVQMQPSMLKGIALTNENSILRLRSALSSHLYTAPCKRPSKKTGVWGNITTDMMSQSSIQSEVPFRSDLRQVVLGIDSQILSEFLLGSFLAYDNASIDWENDAGCGDINSVYAALYSSFQRPHFFFRTTIGGAHIFYSEKRNIDCFAAHREATGNADGNAFFTNVTLSTPFYNFEPFAMLDYIFLHQDRLSETGAKGLNLTVDPSSYDLLRAEIGLSYSTCLLEQLSALLQASYAHESRLRGEKYRARFRHTDCTFTVKGMHPNREIFAYKVGLISSSNDGNRYGSLLYGGEVGTHYLEQSLTLQLGIKL